MKTKFYTKNRTFLGIALLAIILFAGSIDLVAQTFDRNYQDGRLYFKYKDNVNVNINVRSDNSVAPEEIPFINSLRSEYTISKLERPFDLNQDSKLLRTFMIEIDDYSRIDELLNELKYQPDLEYVEKVPMDYISYVPNDSIYNVYNGPSQWNWHMDVIQAEKAWDISKGSADIKVAIVDNAVWADHPDLAAKIVLQRDTYYNNNSSNPPVTGNPDDWSHGTHCAGLAAAISDNGIGIASVGFNVSIIAVKAAQNTNPEGIYGYPGIQWAANNGADVINMSWGGTGYSATNQNLINTIANMGVVLVAAAGNENTSTAHYPSGYNNVISVASSNSDDRKTDFSNFNATVDVSAPGGYCYPGPTGLLSTTWSTDTFGHYGLMYGTSMASPVAAGLAGLICSINPLLTPEQVTNIMKNTTDNIDELNPDYIGMIGTGRINAFRAAANTPYQPTAGFSTPVTTILPGTGIDFTDQSSGVPSTWTWTFQGGTPASSTQQHPANIVYNTAGVFDVTLVVTNEFGTNTLVLDNYVTVTASPLPYISFSVSDSMPCIQSEVTLNDQSLYNPTSWQWTITPGNYEFVNGTSSASQNPQVKFLVPGLYSVDFTATNNNGSSNINVTDLIDVYGAFPSYNVDLEDGTPGYFMVWDTIKSQSKIDARSANESNFGLHFHGDPVPTGWAGSSTSGTAAQAWESNLAFHGKASLCAVDATSMDNVALTLDLRQTFSLGPRFSWFRVLVNGEQVADQDGVLNFNPLTANQDPWRRLIFDLSAYAGTVFDITLQTATRFADKMQGEGDNVFIDNISITNTTQTKPASNLQKSFRIYPNPSDGRFTIALEKSKGAYSLKVVSLLGNVVYTYTGESNGTLLKTVDLSHLPAGVYLMSISDSQQQFNQRLVIR